MAGSSAGGQTPRAMVHKRILDEASDRPNASMQELANEIGGASMSLVERVLEEYGDPAAGPPVSNGGDEMAKSAPSPPQADGQSTGTEPPSVAELTAKQRETLEVIAAHPTATQEDIGERLGVSATTVCNRVTDIPGFSWADRQAFVEEHVELGSIEDDSEGADSESGTKLEARVREVEQQLADIETHSTEVSRQFDPDLARKVAKACLRSEELSAEEELHVLQALFGEPDASMA